MTRAMRKWGYKWPALSLMSAPLPSSGVLFAFKRVTGGKVFDGWSHPPISKGFALEVDGNINGSIDLKCCAKWAILVRD